MDSLHDTSGHIALIAGRDVIIAVAGAPKNEFMDRRVGGAVEYAMEQGEPVRGPDPGGRDGRGGILQDDDENTRFTSYVVAPLMARGGEAVGAVILCSREPGAAMGEIEEKLAHTAASFLGRQMEQ